QRRDPRAATRSAADRRRGGIRARGRARPVADATAGAAVRGAGLSRSVRRADHVRAGAGRAGHVAGLALSVAGARAAHAVEALTARALACRAAGDAGWVLRRADARGAVVPRQAVGIERAIARAGGGAARIRSARDILLGGARARRVAGRSQYRHARAARRVAAGRARARVGARGRVGSVARAAADGAVGGAGGPHVAGGAGDGRAGTGGARLCASLALSGACGVTADAVDAVLRSALIRTPAGLALREQRDADAARAPGAARAVGIGIAVAVACARAARVRGARLRLDGGAGAGAGAGSAERRGPSRARRAAAGD